jgi:hypothetical protein
VPLNDPVKDPVKEPVFTVIGNVLPSPLVNVIVFNDTDAVVILLSARKDVDANEDDIALEALTAQLPVPNNEPVNPNVDVVDPVITNDPVIIALPVYGNDAPPADPVLTVISKVDPFPLVKRIVLLLLTIEAVVKRDPVGV